MYVFYYNYYCSKLAVKNRFKIIPFCSIFQENHDELKNTFDIIWIKVFLNKFTATQILRALSIRTYNIMISKTLLVFEVESPFNDEVMIYLQFTTSFTITYWMA